jgi:hypothetical protein
MAGLNYRKLQLVIRFGRLDDCERSEENFEERFVVAFRVVGSVYVKGLWFDVVHKSFCSWSCM